MNMQTPSHVMTFLCWIVWLMANLPNSNCFYLEYCKMLDLSHPFDSSTIYWPGNPGFQLDELFKGKTDRGFYYAANRFSAAEHGGTHVDAPSHFAEGKNNITKIDPFSLIGEACVVDIRTQSQGNQDYQMTVGDLAEWESSNVALNDDCILVVRTGFAQYWPDKQRYLGTENVEDVDYFHFPGISPEAAQWIVDNRSPKAIAIDTASIDYGQSKDFQSHRIFADNNIPLIENLANIEKLPARHSSIVASIMPIGGGTGAPARVFAYGWDGEEDACRRHKNATAGVGQNYPSIGTLLICIFNAIVSMGAFRFL